MFGLGKKNKKGKQLRLEHRGKHLRISRTGGVALRVGKKVGPVNLTANTSKGVRASTRITKGMHIALQNSRVQLIGRWRTGPLGFNLSKRGVSASVNNKVGSFNFLKPNYSSFKLAGIHLRGKKAAYLQLAYMTVIAGAFLLMFAIRLAIWLSWLGILFLRFLWDFIIGIMFGVSDNSDDGGGSDSN